MPHSRSEGGVMMNMIEVYDVHTKRGLHGTVGIYHGLGVYPYLMVSVWLTRKALLFGRVRRRL